VKEGISEGAKSWGPRGGKRREKEEKSSFSREGGERSHCRMGSVRKEVEIVSETGAL